MQPDALLTRTTRTSETIRKHVSGLEAPVEVMQALRDMKNSFKAAL